MFKDFGEGFQWQHVEVKKITGLLIYRFLQPLLCGGFSGHITDSSGGNIVLRERINQSLTGFGSVCDLGG